MRSKAKNHRNLCVQRKKGKDFGEKENGREKKKEKFITGHR